MRKSYKKKHMLLFCGLSVLLFLGACKAQKIPDAEETESVSYETETEETQEEHSETEEGTLPYEAEPNFSDNAFVKAVRAAGEYGENEIAYAYEADYDGDGETEAFVVTGVENEDRVDGALWFVNSRKKAEKLLEVDGISQEQQYLNQEQTGYLFFSYYVWPHGHTYVYTVKDGEAVEAFPYHEPIYLDETGQIVEIQDAYDMQCEDIGDELLWLGHTWKPYTLVLQNGVFQEIEAREMTLEELNEIAALPDEILDLWPEAPKQYILRENGELDINLAVENGGSIRFFYVVYQLSEANTWRFVEEGDGIYMVSFSRGEGWDYLNLLLPYDSEETELACNVSESQTNPYFFPMETEEKKIEVVCEALWRHEFKGNAILTVRKVQGTKLDGYYELCLGNFTGECGCGGKGDIHAPDCEFAGDFPVGYFYVEEENIYMMSAEEGFLDIFAEVDQFPPAKEYVDARKERMLAAGEHDGYFTYRLVCCEQEVPDTYGNAKPEEVMDGLIWDERYHNFISAEGDRRNYKLYPEELTGTQECMYITWAEGEGIVSYTNWAGALKDYISFCVPGYEEECIFALR